MLDEYLKEKTANKEVFSLAELKRKFPKDKDEIKTYVFCGIIEPASHEFPDSVRALIY